MATMARKETSRSGRSNKRAYELFLLYPTFGIALITAVPTWFEKYQAYRLQVVDRTTDEARRQNELWKKNFSCATAPQSYYKNPRNIQIDATLCDSGDIFVSAITPDTKPHIAFVALDDLIAKEKGSWLFPAANAATLAVQDPTVITVLCQKFIDDRHILRRVQTPQGCFDEVIDTFNGTLVKRTSAPCTPQC